MKPRFYKKLGGVIITDLEADLEIVNAENKKLVNKINELNDEILCLYQYIAKNEEEIDALLDENHRLNKIMENSNLLPKYIEDLSDQITFDDDMDV